ncbi:hypothetical protein [Enterococcus sp. 5H]|uniref:hypothetical protein n=1 Tax=Enterococcus sp. 5H TaxID=1229490 RepID=UPI002302B096|nr:hypothetical protein [Enterococcus sp. 5H]MDA9470553.1 hypothetical protein [Enterococcus sp. 5H]
MKKQKKALLILFTAFILCMIGGQTVQAEGTASNSSKAGITLKIKEEPPTTSEPAPEPTTPSDPVKELPNVPIEDSTPSGKGIVNGLKLLPSMGELTSNGWWLGLGLLLIIGVAYQVHHRRK